MQLHNKNSDRSVKRGSSLEVKIELKSTVAAKLCRTVTILLVKIFFLAVCDFFTQVVYVTATTPFAILLILIIRGVTLPHAVDGLIFYLKPDWSRLADVGVRAGT